MLGQHRTRGHEALAVHRCLAMEDDFVLAHGMHAKRMSLFRSTKSAGRPEMRRKLDAQQRPNRKTPFLGCFGVATEPRDAVLKLEELHQVKYHGLPEFLGWWPA